MFLQEHFIDLKPAKCSCRNTLHGQGSGYDRNLMTRIRPRCGKFSVWGPTGTLLRIGNCRPAPT